MYLSIGPLNPFCIPYLSAIISPLTGSRHRASLCGTLASYLVGTQHCASLWGILELLVTGPRIGRDVMDISTVRLISLVCKKVGKYVKQITMFNSKHKAYLMSPCPQLLSFLYPWGENCSLNNHLNWNNVSVNSPPHPFCVPYRSPCGDLTPCILQGECLRQSLWELNTVHPCGESTPCILVGNACINPCGDSTLCILVGKSWVAWSVHFRGRHCCPTVDCLNKSTRRMWRYEHFSAALI